MKRLLLPFILLFSIPFNVSCIREITFNVTVVYANPENVHCWWDTPLKKARMGHDYTIHFYDEEGWELYDDQDSIYIVTAHFDPVYHASWTYENHILTIKGEVVNSDIEVRVTSDVIQQTI